MENKKINCCLVSQLMATSYFQFKYLQRSRLYWKLVFIEPKTRHAKNQLNERNENRFD